jgi:hypothetical protein
VWLRDGRVIDDSFVTTFENTVRNDLWLPSLDRSDLDATLTCEASNSNLTMPVSTSVTIDLHSEFKPNPPTPTPTSSPILSVSFRFVTHSWEKKKNWFISMTHQLDEKRKNK